MTQLKPIIQRQLGHLSYKSVMEVGVKGNHIASTTINGKKYMGVGATPRLATLDLSQQVNELSKHNASKLPSKLK